MTRLLITLLLLLPWQAGAEDSRSEDLRPLPDWRVLVFEEKAFWATARSELLLDACAGPGDAWCLEATSSVASNRERIELSARPDGHLLERRRFSEGSNRRRKRWAYGLTGITRERLEPDASGEYRLTSRRKIGYPDGERQVTDPLLLLALLSPASAPQSFVVNTDLNLYRVTATPAGEDLVEVSPGLGGIDSRHRDTDLLRIEAELIDPAQDQPDFTLLGLSGELLVAFDRATGLPLQVRGRAPRLGYVALTLKSAELREAAP
ncbi:MAG: hypothetical protein V2I66_06555 [Halieaceae bacterium]|jgi:hypothetical protein|nr:hypothetical protein [Halieaceae bacterium]